MRINWQFRNLLIRRWANALAVLVIATSCAGRKPLKHAEVTMVDKPAQPVEQIVIPTDSPGRVSEQDHQTVKMEPRPVLPETDPPGTNVQAVAISATLPVVECDETHTRTDLAAAQGCTALESGAARVSQKGVVSVGVAVSVVAFAVRRTLRCPLNQLLCFLAAWMRRLVTPLLDVRRERWHCHCQVGSTDIVLTREFLPGAQMLRVELQTPWHVSWRWLMPRLAAQVLDGQRRPLQEQAACAQSCQKGTLSFTVTLPAAAVVEQTLLSIRLSNPEYQDILAEITFACLQREQLLSELKVCRLEVYACLGARRVVTHKLHSGLKHLGACVDLELANAEHRTLFAQIPACITLTLSGPTQRASWQTRLRFSGQTFHWDAPLTAALPLLKQYPGTYQLSLLCEQHALAHLPLTVRSEADAYADALKEVERQATLEQCHGETINHRGESVPLDVVAEDFRQVSLRAEVSIGRPNPLFDEFCLPVICEFRSCNGQPVISRRLLSLTLRPGANSIRFKLPLQPHQFHQATTDCILELRLGTRPLAALQVTHQTRAQISQEKTARLLDSLSLANVELAVERDGNLSITDVIFATDQWLKPRFTARAQGFDEDVPHLEWQLTIKLCHDASRRAFEQSHTLRIRAGANRCRRLAVALEHLRGCLPPGRCTLSLSCHDRLLAQRPFRFLAQDEILPYTQELVLANARVLAPQLVCESRNHSYATEVVPFCAERLRVRGTLRTEGFSAMLPEWNLPLRLHLGSARANSTPVCQTEVTLSPQPVALDLPLSLADTPLLAEPGNYQLELYLAQRQIARIPFRLVSKAQIIEQLEVCAFEMTTCRLGDSTLVPCSQLNLREHRELRIAFALRAGFPIPGFAVPGRLEILAGQRVLFSADFLLPINQEITWQELKPLPAAALWAKAGERAQTLHIQISAAGTVKCRHPLRIELPRRLTTFEGTLREDARSLGNVEDEYEAILQTIG